MIELGQSVREAITGLEGVVVAGHDYLYGCVRISIQPHDHKDGKPAEVVTFDEQQLVALDKPNILKTTPRTNAPGGDRPVPSARHTPSF